MSSELPEGFTLTDEIQVPAATPGVQPAGAAPIVRELPQGFEIVKKYQGGELSPEAGKAAEELERRGLLDLKQTISEYARPTLQAIGATGGAILGGGAGLATGPGAPVAAPMGAVAGGGLGFAIGDDIADLLDQFMGLREPQAIEVELGEAAKNILTGATYEMGGQAAGVALGAAGGYLAEKARKALPAIAGKAVRRKAGEVLAAETTQGPLVAKNMEEAWALEEAIPGLKFSRGQLTDDPAIIKFERAAARAPGDVAEKQLGQKAANTKAIRDFITAKKGPGTLEDVTGALGGQELSGSVRVAAAERALQTEAAGLAGGQSPVAVGAAIRGEAMAGEKAARAAAGELFEAVPEATIDASNLAKRTAELQTPYSKFEAEGNVPPIFGKMSEVIEESGGMLSVDDLQGLRSELGEQLRDARGAAPPNNRLISRLTQARGAVDEALSGEGAGAQLKTATTFFKKEVIDKFRTGAVGDILKGGGKVENAQVASKFFRPGAIGEQTAYDFMSAMGDNPAAMDAIEDYIKQDLLSAAMNPQTGELTEIGLKRWLKKHNLALKGLGLKDKFNTVLKARKQLDDAIEIKSQFDKSAASKLLNADVDTAVKSAFATQQKGKAAKDLMGQLKGDKKAVAGLQNSMIDQIISDAETTAVDAFQNPIVSVAGIDRVMKKYAPALRVIFKDSPDKLKALGQVRDAFRTLQRTSKSPLGGGSDTMELGLAALANEFGIAKGRIAGILRAFMGPIKRMSEANVNAIVNRALVDPEAAFSLINAVKTPKPEVAGRKLTQYLSTLGLVYQEQEKSDE